MVQRSSGVAIFLLPVHRKWRLGPSGSCRYHSFSSVLRSQCSRAQKMSFRASAFSTTYTSWAQCRSTKSHSWITTGQVASTTFTISDASVPTRLEGPGHSSQSWITNRATWYPKRNHYLKRSWSKTAPGRGQRAPSGRWGRVSNGRSSWRCARSCRCRMVTRSMLEILLTRWTKKKTWR